MDFGLGYDPLANSNHILKIKEGVGLWNQWRKDKPEITPDLSWANLNGFNLDGVMFADSILKLAFCKGCSFVGADFSGANLRGTNLERCDLRGAIFRKTDLEGAHLIGSDLASVDFSGANLNLANFDGANLRDVDFTGARKLTTFQLLRLGYVENLKGVSDKIMENIKPFLDDSE